MKTEASTAGPGLWPACHVPQAGQPPATFSRTFPGLESGGLSGPLSGAEPGPGGAGVLVASCTALQSLPRALITSDRGHQEPAAWNTVAADWCQHLLKVHKNKLSIGLPVGKIDSVQPTVAGISNDRGAHHVPVIGSNSWTGIKRSARPEGPSTCGGG